MPDNTEEQPISGQPENDREEQSTPKGTNQ